MSSRIAMSVKDASGPDHACQSTPSFTLLLLLSQAQAAAKVLMSAPSWPQACHQGSRCCACAAAADSAWGRRHCRGCHAGADQSAVRQRACSSSCSSYRGSDLACPHAGLWAGRPLSGMPAICFIISIILLGSPFIVACSHLS